MFQRKDFASYIEPFTLRFHMKKLEEESCEIKDERIKGLNAFKIAIIIFGFLHMIMILIQGLRFYEDENYDKFVVILTLIVVSGGGVAAEYILHCFSQLRALRGFCFMLSISFSVAYYGFEELHKPGVLIG